MISVVIFTFKRLNRLNQCLRTLDSSNIDEVLIFNDDETKELINNDLEVNYPFVKIYNPSNWGFSNRKFRKPIYINKAVNMAKNNKILFSDDDGKFNKGAIDSHFFALNNYQFSAGAIVRDRFFNRKSKRILQGTNYAFHRSFFLEVGGYDEKYCDSIGGGDVEFWYRIYKFSQSQNIPVAYLPNAIQKVTGKGSRNKLKREINPKEYTLNKHDLYITGPMYRWFPEIRDKGNWMTIIEE